MASSIPPEWNIPTWPDLVMGVWVFFTIHLQEFHDVGVIESLNGERSRWTSQSKGAGGFGWRRRPSW
jgi:hypothetical protein